ncbi:MAG: hypothetical protein GY941_05390 [Planctomycetes bacterium]|nr:hypothetical protein [Planctomycetota bacterium]
MAKPKVKYLGALCKQGHSHEGTGRSLRYSSNCRCVVCTALSAVEWEKENPGKRKAAVQKWKKKNPEKAKAANQKWSKANPEKAKAANQKWSKANPEKAKAAVLEWISSLSDGYVKSRLGLKKGDNAPLGLIEAKRLQLEISRLIREMKNGK